MRHCPVLRRDYAKVSYLYSCCLRATRRNAEADAWLARSVDAYNSLRPDDVRDSASLKWDDIDGLVVYDYLDSLDVEFGDYAGCGYMESWLESASESESEDGREDEPEGTSEGP